MRARPERACTPSLGKNGSRETVSKMTVLGSITSGPGTSTEAGTIPDSALDSFAMLMVSLVVLIVFVSFFPVPLKMNLGLH